MDYLTLVLQIATIIIIIVGGFFLKNYLPSYFSEKGKNLATREDIEEITNKIEKTKTQYIFEIEKLKSALALASGEKARIREQQWNTLITFYEDCSTLCYDTLPLPGFIDPNNKRFLYEFTQSTSQLFTRIGASYFKMLVVFPENHIVLDRATDLMNKVTVLRKAFQERFVLAVDKRWEADLLIEQDKEDSEETQKLLKEMIREMILYENDIKPMIEEMIDALLNYIHALRIYLREQGISVASE